MKNALIALLVLFTSTLAPLASPAADESPPVAAKLIADTTAVVPGQSLKLGVELKIAPGWHVYYKTPGDTGRATTVDLLEPDGLSPGELGWRKPYRFDIGGFRTYGYLEQTVIVLPIQVPTTLKPGDKLIVKVLVTWLACKDECQPGETELTLELPVVTAAAASVNADSFANVNFTGSLESTVAPSTHGGSGTVLDKDFETAPPTADFATIIGALFAAFIGGILLNLMPCVLPVLSLKVLSFVKQAGDDKKRIWRMGLAYSAGTMGTFLVLALVVIGVQLGGHSVGWGFQFQHPLFIIAMVTLITVMSLSLFGLFYVQISNGGGGIDRLAQKEGYLGAFAKGVSATILSTPCTAPFLGSALGFAFSQPWWIVIAIFLTVGAGLSAPYMLLCWKPGWMKYLPKPGDWMERFKEAMGLLMLASAAWLLFVLGKQAGAQVVSATVVFLLAVSTSAWLVGRFADFNASFSRRIIIWFVALTLAAASFWQFVLPALKADQMVTAHTATEINGVTFEPFSAEALQKHLDEGKIVLVDFTADWCLTCKINEQVLTGQTVTDHMRANNVVVLTADWTRGDAQITKLLQKFGRSGVPLYVVFSPKDQSNPILLPELITPQIVIDALDSAKK